MSERMHPSPVSMCPDCTNGSMDIAQRMEMATALGVRHVSLRSEPSLDGVAGWGKMVESCVVGLLVVAIH